MLYASSALALASLIGAGPPAPPTPPAPDRPGLNSPAGDNTISGVVRTAGVDSLTITDKEGKRETTFAVGKDAQITCDGKQCDLKDVARKGISVTVTAKKSGDAWYALRIEARSEETNRDKDK
jgi:hypothetical protein